MKEGRIRPSFAAISCNTAWIMIAAMKEGRIRPSFLVIWPNYGLLQARRNEGGSYSTLVPNCHNSTVSMPTLPQ